MSTLEQPSNQLAADQASLSDGGRDHPGLAERLIKPSRGWIAIDWAEIFQSRDLLNTLVMRDIRVRYKQTVLGVGWAILQPLASMLVFTFAFAAIPGVQTPGIPYPLFLLAGLIPWTFFMNSVTGAGTSLMAQQHLITKIYFPRVYVPASTIGTQLVDMGVGMILFGLVMPYYHYAPSINIIFLPLVVLMTFIAACGLGLIFASITVLYRDLRFIIPYMMSLLMFASPIFYPLTMQTRNRQLIMSLNPVTGIVTAYRWCILGTPLDVPALLISLVATIFVLVFGLFFFRRTERYIADLI